MTEKKPITKKEAELFKTKDQQKICNLLSPLGFELLGVNDDTNELLLQHSGEPIKVLVHPDGSFERTFMHKKG